MLVHHHEQVRWLGITVATIPRPNKKAPNPGRIALELIEVQVGSYLGGDDIVRIDDVYGGARPNGGSG
jgi:hypothetical protein